MLVSGELHSDLTFTCITKWILQCLSTTCSHTELVVLSTVLLVVYVSTVYLLYNWKCVPLNPIYLSHSPTPPLATVFFFFNFNWRLITLQYYIGFVTHHLYLWVGIIFFCFACLDSIFKWDCMAFFFSDFFHLAWYPLNPSVLLQITRVLF